MNKQFRSRFVHQAGSVLLEGLFAILIFSMGVLAIVGLQVASVKQSAEGKYRSDASMLASELIGRMWVGDRTASTLKERFEEGGAEYDAWIAEVQATLPGVDANPPTVNILSVPGGGGSAESSRATITVRWKAPNAGADDPAHSYTVVAQIK